MGLHAEFLEAARDAALEAGALLSRDYHRLGEVRFKGEINLVTATDQASQDLIFGRLSARFPGHDFLAEEGLARVGGSAFRWVFDPLDGTTNFAHRFPVFCVSIALEGEGRLVCGVVHNPMSGETFWAEAGEGAWLDGRRIRVSSVDDLVRSLVATGFSYDIRESRANMAEHDRVLLKAQGVRRCGSAALDLCGVACGRFDGFWELKLNPWDTAAGALLVAEAGGRVTDFEGRPADIYRPEVVASNGRIHEALIGVLRAR
ncbi:MAG: inositol monophosphatase [Candidatus Aminicenantes bacterium]|nr:inositol monophosphatase [Candidatus Aminicenantes bacterium]